MPARSKDQLLQRLASSRAIKGETSRIHHNIKELMGKAKVQALLGNKDLLIKHTIPESLIAIY